MTKDRKDKKEKDKHKKSNSKEKDVAGDVTLTDGKMPITVASRLEPSSSSSSKTPSSLPHGGTPIMVPGSGALSPKSLQSKAQTSNSNSVSIAASGSDGAVASPGQLSKAGNDKHDVSKQGAMILAAGAGAGA